MVEARRGRRRCRYRSNGSRPSRNRARRCRSCRGSTIHPPRRVAGSWSWRQALRRRESRFRISTSPLPPCAEATRRSRPAASCAGQDFDGGPRPAEREGRAASRCRRLARPESDTAAGAPARTVARTSAPWVTSGSSPASLTMPAMAEPSPSVVVARAKAGRCPRGKVIDGVGKRAGEKRRGRLGGAAAQAPVVQP